MTEDYLEPPNTNPDSEATYQEILDAPDTHPSLHPTLYRLAGQDTDQRAASNHPNLVDNREVAYEALFQGELPYEPQPDEQDIGLSGLYREYTSKKGKPRGIEESHYDRIPEIINAILSDHESLSRSPEGANGGAIFSFLKPEYQTIIMELTSGAIIKWEKALIRNEQPFLISEDTGHLDDISNERLAHLVGMRSLVIETAAAMLEVLPISATKPMDPTIADKNELINIISNWGPKFAKEWFSGTIIEEHLRKSGLEDSEIQERLHEFTPALRRRLLYTKPQRPLEQLDRVIANITLMKDDKAIATRLGWSVDEVKEFFTSSSRKTIAVGNITDPMSKLDKIRVNFELLTDDNLGNHIRQYELDDSQIQEFLDSLIPSRRRQIAIDSIDPLKTIDKIFYNLKSLTDESIASALNIDPREAGIMFTRSMRAFVSYGNIKDPMSALANIKRTADMLTDDNIASELGIDPIEASEILPSSQRIFFAFSHRKNPMAALRRIRNNIDMLTEDNIASELGISIEAAAVITKKMKQYFAKGNLKNPLSGVSKYLRGEVTYGGSTINPKRRVNL